MKLLGAILAIARATLDASGLTTTRTLVVPDKDGTLAVVSDITATAVGLGSANNTADSAKPVSTAQQTALDGKAPLTGGGTSGTWGISVTGTAANVTGTVAVANGGTGATTGIAASQTVVNYGQLEDHGEYTNFNLVKKWGSSYVLGTGNGPGIPDAGQYYQSMFSLGNAYLWGGQVYAMQTAIPRANGGALPYLSVRFKEGGTDEENWGAWSKIYAGYADTAGAVAWANVSGKPTNVSSFSNDSGYITASGATALSGIDSNIEQAVQDGTISSLVGQDTNGSLYRYSINALNAWLNGNTLAINVTGNATTLTGSGSLPTGTDWNIAGNKIQQIVQENFTGGSTNFPEAASYLYGTLQTLDTGTSWARAQIYISHAGNDLCFRGGWGTDSWQTWNKVLTNQNYTGWAPSLLGVGASGTWGINITGSAASATGNAGTVTNGVYTNGSYADPAWITSLAKSKVSLGNVDNTADSAKPVSTAQQTALDGKAPLTGAGTSGTWGISISGSAEQLGGIVPGRFVYGSSSTAGSSTANATQNVYEFSQYRSGFWDVNGAAWAPNASWFWGATFAHTSNSGSYNYSGQLVFQDGNGGDGLYARTISNGTPSGWSRLLSSGNFNSYAPTLTGTGASGTWGINVTGSAGSVAWGNISSKPDYGTGINSNYLVQRNGDGYIYANYINFNQSETENPTISSFLTSSGDGWARKSSAAHVISQLSLLTTGNYNSYAPTLTGTGASGTWAINITGSASAASSLNAAGATIYGTYGLGWESSVQVREAGLNGVQGNDSAAAPKLAFHWAGVVASQIAMEASGRIAIINNPGTSYEAFRAAAITGDSFSGAGTGLTGTAASLSIGGSAGSVAWTNVSGRPSYDTSITADTLVQRSSNGDIYVGHVYVASSETENPTIGTFFVSNGDGWSRKATGAHVISQLALATTTNSVALSNKTLTNPTITNYTETVYAPGAGTAFTVDLANGTMQKFTTNGNCTITLPSAVAGKSYTIDIVFGGTHTLTWAGGTAIRWPAATTPTATSVNTKRDSFGFKCTDTSSTHGSVIGQNYAA